MWTNLNFNANLIQHDTDRALLIKLPKSRHQFWHPKACVRMVRGSGDSMMSVGIADDMKITTFVPGAGKHNRRERYDERTYTAEEFIKQMGGQCGNTAPVNVGTMSRLVDILQTAKQHLKWPKIRLHSADGEVVVSLAGDKSKNAGFLYVKRPFSAAAALYGQDGYLGKIDAESGKYHPSRTAPESVATALKTFSDDPEKAAGDYGHLTGNCCFCSRALTDERSTDVGYGKTCAGHYGLPWGAK